MPKQLKSRLLPLPLYCEKCKERTESKVICGSCGTEYEFRPYQQPEIKTMEMTQDKLTQFVSSLPISSCRVYVSPRYIMIGIDLPKT